ncbi:MAG TPA: hypothetical protein VGT03_15620 [Candidatus Acidoferrales bacterium]|nr:hypothetical protein [Candidatus Acidoferrales bacterium]
MIRSSTLHSGSCAIAILALVCLSSCAEPLAPGYKIEKQSITVRFVPGSPAHLAIRAEYRLANTGNASLEFMDVGLPARKSFGRENLRVQINGRDAVPAIERGEDADEGESSSPEEWPVVWRIPFSPAWPRKQKRNLSIEYDLTAAAEPRLRMYVSPAMFYLNDSGWFPNPLAPKNFLAKDLVRPDPAELHIIVPEGFRAMGSGEWKGTHKSNGATDFRFQMRKDDFDPFLIAGKYFEQQITTSAGGVNLWTFTPLSLPQAQASALQIATARKFYQASLHPLPNSMKAIYDVELPKDFGDEIDLLQAQAAELPFLPGVVYDWLLTPGKSFWTKLGNGFAASFGQIELSYSWFGHMARPQSDAWILAQELTSYLSNLENDANGNDTSRAENISSVLRDYDEDVRKAAEKPLLSLTPSDSKVQLQLGADKTALFLYALEDRCGRDNLTHAIAHMISALRFQQYGYDDFRSAVEEECHQDLGPFFRTWLNEKGIPAEFRAKYEPAVQKKN